MLIVRFFQDSRCAATTDGRIYVPMDRVTSPESVVTSVEVYGNAKSSNCWKITKKRYNRI